MKIFIKKFILIFSPIIIFFFITESLLRNIPNDYSYKNEYFEKNAENIETLFLGNSHAYYGINPEYFTGNSFNASHISQTIDLDLELIKKYSSRFEELKYLVVPIDYPTLFTRASTGQEKWRMKNYNIYYGLNLSSSLGEYFEVLSFDLQSNFRRMIHYYYWNRDNLTCSEFGYGNVEVEPKDLIETGKSAAERHTKEDKSYFTESVDIINEMISYAEKNDINMLFYTSPAYETYWNNLDSAQLYETINTIEEICNNHQNTRYINLLSSSSFVATDFWDADHLNKNGAKKLTKIINDNIQKFKNE